jgi:arsenate reductase
MDNTPKVLFLSRGTASRAQIAERFARAMAGNQLIPFSAGTESAAVNPIAAEVMSEVGIDISTQQPHEVASLFRENFRYAVALSDEPRERHPVFPFTRNVLRWSVWDPEVATSEPEAKRQAFRQIRDQIRSRVEELIEAMNHPDKVFAKVHTAAA